MEQRKPPALENQVFTLRGILPVLIPLGSVAASLLSVAIAFTKVQMESNVNAAQLNALDTRLDRLADAFTGFRGEQNKENRDRDRIVERNAALNDAQNLRLEQLTAGMRRLEEMLYRQQPRQQSWPEPSPLPEPSTQEAHNATELHQ